MREYKPDHWIILQIGDIQKVLGGWSGGYLDPDNWRLSSGIKEIKENENEFEVHNDSGSVYHCVKGREGMTILTSSICSKIENLCKDDNIEFKVLEMENEEI